MEGNGSSERRGGGGEGGETKTWRKNKSEKVKRKGLYKNGKGKDEKNDRAKDKN